MTKTYRVKYVYPEKVLRIYRIMRNNPNKVYIIHDFGRKAEVSKHLFLLMKLGIIEKVDTYLHRGNSLTRGYKLKK